MGNKTPTKTSFGPDRQPPNRRGQGKRTKMIGAMTDVGYTEEEFLALVTMRAFEELGVYNHIKDKDEKNELMKRHKRNHPGYTFAKEVLIRLVAVPKLTTPEVDFAFTKDADPIMQANEILAATANGSMTGVTVEIMEKLLHGIEVKNKIVEFVELVKDVEAIKEAMANDD